MSFMLHPSRQNSVPITAVPKGLGINQTAVNPVWEPPSYSPDTSNFNRDIHLTRLGYLLSLRSCRSGSHTLGALALRVGVFGMFE